MRPTQDVVREALFSMLALEVPNSAFLDLFAGSGSVGLEAWSRGAKFVCWVEEQQTVARTLRENVLAMKVSEKAIYCDDVFRWLKNPLPFEPFDIVYADPPYAGPHSNDGIQEVMQLLAQGNVMAENGVFVAEQRTGKPMPVARGWARIKDRRYGRTRLTLFTRTQTPA